MKRTTLTMTLFLFIALSLLSADHRIEGFWQSIKTDLVIEIDRDRNGIRVRNAERGKWRYYPEIFASDSYGNRYGKKFKLLDRNELVWIENSVVNADRFLKIDNRNLNYRDSHDHHDYLGAPSCDFDNHICNGDWVARSNRSVLRIQPTRFGLEVNKDDSYRWRDYRAISRRKFRDSRGNSIKFLDDDSIVWKSDCGRYKIYYDRVRHRHRGHRH